MKVVGTHDEITYIMLQCQKKADCGDCVLNMFCSKGMFMRLNPRQLDAFESGQYTPILIAKGDDSSGNQVQELHNSTES